MLQRARDDIRAVKERDPAATSTAAVLINYPGLHALWWHRVNHWLWNSGRTGISRFGSQLARWFTGIEIHPGATIGDRFFIDHGSGVVIGETAIIGNDVTLYQGVTLGGTGKETGKRHPTLEDCVVVGVGAAVLGNITIGRGSKVGGGAVVIDDVPPNCTVVGVPGRVVVRSGERVEAIDLHHEDLPDPVVEMFVCLTRRVDKLERRLARDESLSEERGEPPFPFDAAQDEPSPDDEDTACKI
ncbi:MAG: serine O-acetyltransferase [Actinobacteria bacterium HGW-Actinobacteria-7]|jgi:serine O-acetyltransferase|nr:MAG: serine O-acetyltransferase [Actinobacteria bacterium HGW-Actinobacteria-7]